MVEKNRAMDTANDTVLSLEIECNVLRERVAETERENAMLVARWLAEKEAQATRMNEMLR